MLCGCVTHLQAMQQIRTVLAALLAGRVCDENVYDFARLQQRLTMQMGPTPYIMSDEMQLVAIVRRS